MTQTLAPVIPLVPKPRPEDAYTEHVRRLAEAMCDAGVTPAQLRREPALAKYIPALTAAIAARGAT